MPSPTTEHVLLIDCQDRPGLVHGISGILYHAGANLLSNQEFVDTNAGRFFMRTAFVGIEKAESLIGALRETLPPNANLSLRPAIPPKMVVLATKEHHCLADLLVRHTYHELGAEILAVVSNHAVLGELAARFSVPFHHVSHEGLSREAHEEALEKVIAPYQPEYLVLAKYMRVLSPAFIRRRPQRIINIHHSFLPAFVGAKPYHQAFDRGVKVIGATSHFVTEALDEGPIIGQQVITVNHSYMPEDLAAAGRDVESLVLSKTVKLLSEDRVILHGKRTVIFD